MLVNTLSICNDGEGFSEAKSVKFTVKADGAWHTYRVRMDGNPDWRGNIARLRLDPVSTGSTDAGHVQVDRLRFINVDLTYPPVFMEVFDPGTGARLYQAYRNKDNNTYTRYTKNGSTWSSPVKGKPARSNVAMAVFDPGSGPRLYQSIVGTDNVVYTRYTKNADTWTSWVQGRSARSDVSMAVFDPGGGPRLYQAVRGTDNRVYTRYTKDGNLVVAMSMGREATDNAETLDGDNTVVPH